MQARYDQKMIKYGSVAERNSLRLIPAVFSHTGQTHGEFKAFVREQVRHKLITNSNRLRRRSEKLEDWVGDEMVVEMHIYGHR